MLFKGNIQVTFADKVPQLLPLATPFLGHLVPEPLTPEEHDDCDNTDGKYGHKVLPAIVVQVASDLFHQVLLPQPACPHPPQKPPWQQAHPHGDTLRDALAAMSFSITRSSTSQS
jgi:hypothetical protein